MAGGGGRGRGKHGKPHFIFVVWSALVVSEWVVQLGAERLI